jgi:hypothetical protein
MLLLTDECRKSLATDFTYKFPFMEGHMILQSAGLSKSLFAQFTKELGEATTLKSIRVTLMQVAHESFLPGK